MSFFVSVIIPTFKPKDYLLKCIDSLFYQSFSKEKFEVIFVLNGPRDPYYNFIEENLIGKGFVYRVEYIVDKGVSRARNYGLDIAKGEFILFLDDDDFLSENYLMAMSRTYLCTKKTDLIVSDFRRINDSHIITKDYMSDCFEKLLALNDTNLGLLKYSKFLSSACGKLISRKIISKVRFEVGLDISEDALFMFSISRGFTNVVLVNEEIFYYRFIRQDSSSRTKNSFIFELEAWFTSVFFFSKVYFSSPFEYSFYFYINRVAALSKFLIYRLLKK